MKTAQKVDKYFNKAYCLLNEDDLRQFRADHEKYQKLMFDGKLLELKVTGSLQCIEIEAIPMPPPTHIRTDPM